MKRGVLILALGLFTAVAAFACVYLVCIAPARSLQRNERPELAWLKEEFNLGDAEFKRVSELHAAYLPECQERCRQIDGSAIRTRKGTNPERVEIPCSAIDPRG